MTEVLGDRIKFSKLKSKYEQRSGSGFEALEVLKPNS
jgi:hypothetical protein